MVKVNGGSKWGGVNGGEWELPLKDKTERDTGDESPSAYNQENAKSRELSDRGKLFLRVNRAADYMQVKPSELQGFLYKRGLSIGQLDSYLVTDRFIENELHDGFYRCNPISIRAAAQELKGMVQIDTIENPIAQKSDYDLLYLFDSNNEEVYRELEKRSRGKRFIVLSNHLVTHEIIRNGEKVKISRGCIDVLISQKILRDIRKNKETPLVYFNNVAIYNRAPVYTVRELIPSERYVEFCPLCEEPLWENWCDKCRVSFKNLNRDTRSALQAWVAKVRGTLSKTELDRVIDLISQDKLPDINDRLTDDEQKKKKGTYKILSRPAAMT
jgi:hypothetical protein